MNLKSFIPRRPLGNLATLFPGETPTYDPVAGQITNHAVAGHKLSLTYRNGWKI